MQAPLCGAMCVLTKQFYKNVIEKCMKDNECSFHINIVEIIQIRLYLRALVNCEQYSFTAFIRRC